MAIPDKLRPLHAGILKDPKHQKPIDDFLHDRITWSDKSLSNVKSELRGSLRTQQDQRCFFCRRPIIAERRNVYESIEHYLDKSKPAYKRWAFHPHNLTLSCQGCNIEKGIRDGGDMAIKTAYLHPPRHGNYRWIHPYFDNYAQNIEILHGPIYRPRPGAPKHQQAINLIKDLKFDNLKELEKRKNDLREKLDKMNRVAARCIVSGRRINVGLRILELQRVLINEGFV